MNGECRRPTPTPPNGAAPEPTPAPTAASDENANIDANANTADPEAMANADLPPVEPTPAPPDNVLTFRTEQIYIVNSEGEGLKPLTQNEGLIYFYYVWSPAARCWPHWQLRVVSGISSSCRQMTQSIHPIGRPRVTRKTGRESAGYGLPPYSGMVRIRPRLLCIDNRCVSTITGRCADAAAIPAKQSFYFVTGYDGNQRQA